jgi:hypothetical protein
MWNITISTVGVKHMPHCPWISLDKVQNMHMGTCLMSLTLVVNDFGLQYVGGEHADHLFNALEQSYTMSKDWSVSL